MYKTQTHIYKFNGYDIAALASNGSIYIIVKMNGCFKPIGYFGFMPLCSS